MVLSDFWRTTYLQGVSLFTTAFGFGMVILPDTSNKFFSFLFYGDTKVLDNYEPESLRHVTLLTGALGSVIMGFATSLYFASLPSNHFLKQKKEKESLETAKTRISATSSLLL